MADPDNVAVPRSTLGTLLRLAREGVSPKIHWSESREKMDTQAMRIRTELFTEIENEIEALMAHEPRPH